MNISTPMPRLLPALGSILALIFLAAPASARDALTSSSALTFTEGPDSLPYRLYQPDGFNTPGAKFPLVIFLHGNGERGTNNTSQVTSHIQGLIDRTQTGATAAYLIAPQAPAGGQSTQWTNIPYSTSYSNPTLNSPAITTPLRLALDLIDNFIANNNVDPSRVYITGLSMGGYGAFDAIARRPNLFAAALPLSGGGNTGVTSTYVNIPIWAIHGSADTTVLPAGSRNTITAIENAGGTRERYTEILGGGHGPWAPIYSATTYDYDTNYTGTFAPEGSGDVYTWMFAQSVPEPATGGLLLTFAATTLLQRRRPHRTPQRIINN